MWNLAFNTNKSSNLEGQDLEGLLRILQGFQPRTDHEDNFVWWTNSSRFFVKASFTRLEEIANVRTL